MPKTASSAVIWSSERKSCEFYEQHGKKHCRSPYNRENWHSWLDTRTSFSFQGHSGRLSLLKEPRPRGAGYWYAYRRYGGKIVKKYMGRTSDLSIERPVIPRAGSPWKRRARSALRSLRSACVVSQACFPVPATPVPCAAALAPRPRSR